MIRHPDLLTLVEAYVTSTKKSEATVANYAGTDSRFFARLRGGARCWPEMDRKVQQWFSDHWPDGIEWPSHIERQPISANVRPARRPQWGKSEQAAA